jgi:hypothetical protein
LVLTLVDLHAELVFSCPQSTARLAPHHCSGCPLGNPRPCVQHSTCLLRRLPQ